MKNKFNFKWLLLSIILSITSINQAFAWYIPGTINGERWGATDNNMGGDNQITFYAVAAGYYKCKLTDGTNWKNGSWTADSGGDGISISYDDGNIGINVTTPVDITIAYSATDQVKITTSGPTYHIRYPFGGTWSTKQLVANGDGTYSGTGLYNGSASGFNYIKISSEGDDCLNWAESTSTTTTNSPSSSSDNCIFTFDPSTNKLDIRKCNTVTKNNYIYFDNTTANWSNSYIYFVIGKPEYSGTYATSAVTNTKLRYVSYTGDAWSDCGYYAMIGADEAFGSGSWGQGNISAAAKYSAPYTTSLDLESGYNYIIGKASADNGTAITMTKQGNAASALNSNQTIKYALSMDNGSTFTEVTEGKTLAALTISAYKFVNGTYNSVSNTSNSQTISADQSSTYSAYVPAGYTAATSLSYTSLKTGYTFVDWRDAVNGGNAVTSPYYPTGAKTIYARIKANQYTITLNRNGGSGDNQQVTATYDAGTLSASVTTPERSGYTFTGWYTKNGGADGVGVQVINTSGTFNSSVSDDTYTYTDASGHWVYDGNLTLYARWKANGDVNKYNFQAGSGAYYGSGWTITTFAAEGTTLSANYTMPNPASVTKYYVGYNADFYNSDLGSNNAKSSEENMTDLPLMSSGNAQVHAIGTATGATGKLIAFSNSSEDNLYVGFQPDGYGLTYNSETLAFGDADANTMRQTATVTLVSGDVSGTFKVGLKTSSGYVDCAKTHSDAASDLNTRKAALVERGYPAIDDLASGQKGRFVIWDSNTADANNWYLAFLPVYTITYNGNGSDGGSVPASPAECINNDSFTVLDNTNSLVKTGYSFGGWTANVDVTIGGETVDAGTTIAADAVITTVGSDITLSAVWTPVALTFKADATTSAWGTASNWSPACVPTSGHDVTIKKAVTVSGEAEAKSITFDGGSLTIAATGVLEVAGTITNTDASKIVINTTSSSQGALIYSGSTSATVELSLTGDWQLIALPVAGVSVSSAFAGKGVYTYVWNNTNKVWDRRGYYEDLMGNEAILVTGSSGYNFSGSLIAGSNRELGVNYDNTKASGDVSMFGNSWPAPIKLSNVVFDGNVENAVHFLNSGGSWTGEISSGVIPAMQGFAVVSTGTGGGTMYINYDRDVRNATSPNAPLKAPKHSASNIYDHITIHVNGNEWNHRIRLYENEQFTNDIDNGFEAVHMEGEGIAGELYVQAEKKMNILAVPDLEGTVVGFVPGQPTNYTISFEGDGRGYYLNDTKMGEATLIEEGNTYDFTPGEGDNSTRFVISRTPIAQVPTDVDAINDGVKARKQMINGVLYIIRDGRIYDVMGKSVK